MDLWKYLKNTDKPIVIYGMGNGADKILSVFDHYGIKCAGIFASDDFYRPGKCFQGMAVERYSDFCSRYEDFIVLVSFATSIAEVRENILRIAAERELYAPCVPVYGDTLFNDEYYEEHKADILCARELLYDERSKEIFDNIISYRLSGKLEYLFGAESDPCEVWEDILDVQKYVSIADCGAYTGDTAAEFIQKCPNVKRIYALEPDPKNFKKLTANEDERIIPINKGAWDKAESVEFNMGAGRGAAQGKKGKTVMLDFDTLDNVTDGEAIDYIKYDVEGAELKALTGSEETIKKHSPDLLVSLYHRTEDIFELVMYVHRLCPCHRLYLRRFSYIPDWDINLYVIKEDS
ncbi:MAG: FkbM family methyltransferase [Clostridia bacterium]|nr:FkbM family methyltransferase [Clostridia bacterium]